MLERGKEEMVVPRRAADTLGAMRCASYKYKPTLIRYLASVNVQWSGGLAGNESRMWAKLLNAYRPRISAA